MNINNKQRRFITEYLLDLNSTQAAIRAGYSYKTARQVGSRLLTNVDIKREIDLEIFRLHDSQKKKLALASEKAINALLDVLEHGTNSAKVSAANSILDRAGHIVTSKMLEEFNSAAVDESSEESKEEALSRFIDSLSKEASKMNMN